MIEEREWKKEDEDEAEFNPLEYVEEERDHLEKLAEIRERTQDKEFPAHLLITDPLWAREVIQKSKQERSQSREIPPHPAPEIPVRYEKVEDCPRSVKTVVKLLEKDWDYRITYARGSLPGRWARTHPDDEHTTWTTRVVDSHVVKARGKKGQWFVATWVDGQTSAVFWIEDMTEQQPGQWIGTRAKKIGMTELKKRLKEVANGDL